MKSPQGTATRTGVNPPFVQGRIVELDGLRGMAIIFVALFHYVSDQGTWLDAASGPVPGTFLYYFQRLFAMGWAGVDLFFVLSGFLIGGILLDARSSTRYFRTFYARRFFRIIPLYYLFIASYFLLVLTPLHTLLRALPESLRSNPEPLRVVPVYFLFLQNSVKIAHGNLGMAWLGQLWSLAVEEQFYLLMPLAVYFLPRHKLIPLLCAAVLGAPIARVALWYFVPQHHAAQYVLTLCRADALSMGVLLAIGYRKEEWKAHFLCHKRFYLFASSIPFLAAIFMSHRDPSPYTRDAAIWGLSCIDISCAFLLIVAILFPGGLWASICRWPFLVQMGRLSYCLYVIHQVVNLLCHEVLLGASPRFMDWKSAGVTILAGLIVVGLATLSWIYFEEPLLKRGHAYRYFPAHREPS